MKTEQVAGFEQTKQEGTALPIESNFQPELETLHSSESTPNREQSSVSLPKETKKKSEHAPEQNKELKEPARSIVKQPKAVAERSSGTKIESKEMSNVVKSNDGF